MCRGGRVPSLRLCVAGAVGVLRSPVRRGSALALTTHVGLPARRSPPSLVDAPDRRPRSRTPGSSYIYVNLDGFACRRPVRVHARGKERKFAQISDLVGRGNVAQPGLSGGVEDIGPLPILLLGGRRFSARLTARGRPAGGQAVSRGRRTPPWTSERVKWGRDGSRRLIERRMGELSALFTARAARRFTSGLRHSCGERLWP